jgi:hypothetical protein
LPYTDKYERDIYGIIDFWVRDHFDHGRFFDREISHHEQKLAQENQNAIQRLGVVLKKVKSKSQDVGNLLDEAYHESSNFLQLLTDTLDRHMRCQLVISTPHLLMVHMIREAEESLRVFNIIRSGNKVPAAEASIHENFFWLRVMSEHISFIRHYSDPMNYEFNEKIDRMLRTFNDLVLQATAFKSLVRKPRTDEMYPSLVSFNQHVIKSAKSLEKFKLELDDMIKQCAIITTSPPDLLEHIAREAHHFWRNLDELVIL